MNEFYKNRVEKYGVGHWCKECWKSHRHTDEYRARARELNYQSGRSTPLKDNPSCPLFMGSYIAEHMIDIVFPDAKRAPMGNRGFDFICPNEHTVDVKSSAIRYLNKVTPFWQFDIKRNKIPNYFLLIAYDNRDDLNPLHIWLVPGEIVNMKASVHITNSDQSLSKWTEYERTDVLEKYLEKWPKIKDEIKLNEETGMTNPDDDGIRLRNLLAEIYNSVEREDSWGEPLRYLIPSYLVDKIAEEIQTG